MLKGEDGRDGNYAHIIRLTNEETQNMHIQYY